MNRPWKIWLAFALCSAVMLGVMGWVSGTALRLDRAQIQAQAQAELEEKTRLALWRMDSMLAPLIAQESARPYFTYNAFHPAERAYSRMFNEILPGEVLVPSPLLTELSPNVLLHFQIDPAGRLTSPQAPAGNQRDLAEVEFTTHERVELAAARLRDFERLIAQPNASGSLNKHALLAAAPAPQPGANVLNLYAVPTIKPTLPPQPGPGRKETKGSGSARQQIALSQDELQARAQSVQQAFDVNLRKTFANTATDERPDVVEGLFKPVWLGDALVLVRRVTVEGREYVQGCWLDWPGIQQSLLAAVKDLLPTATLEPIRNNHDDLHGRILAALPLRVVPGPAESSVTGVASPVRFALLLAWIGVLVAGMAVALLLQGTLSLSERRAAFVSAVTHELRTPLTTFKMYSEMLAGGMVPGEKKQREYLASLCAEANRLNHLVENVLAYARLERGSARSRVEKVALRELIERVKPRLVQRAEQAGMTLQEDVEPRALETIVQVDVAAVEQILFNLVDNACKYAAPSATNRIVHLEACGENDAHLALLRVRDHGQGISAAAARRLFQPFSKSAQEAARTAPGVGLGLALCRRLSRSLGGDLRFNASATGGACFDLFLPMA